MAKEIEGKYDVVLTTYNIVYSEYAAASPAEALESDGDSKKEKEKVLNSNTTSWTIW